MNTVELAEHKTGLRHRSLLIDLGAGLARATEAAALAARARVGHGDKNGADALAVQALREALASVEMQGVVVIGEGEKDQAPMLYTGEEVGDGTGPACDIALDPIDGTTLLATGRPGALSVIAVAPRGSMHVPAGVFYMEKIACGPAGRGVVDLRQSPSENITALAEALGRAPSELTVAVQDRPRHATLVAQVLATGARVRSFSDGDVAAALLAARTGSGVDLLLGTGGAPEGVLAAAAVGSLGGLFQGRLAPTTDEQVAAAHRGGFDLDEVLQIEDLVGYDYAFVATGITDSELAPGIHSAPGGLVATTLVLGSGGAVRRIVTSEYPTPRSAQ